MGTRGTDNERLKIVDDDWRCQAVSLTFFKRVASGVPHRLYIPLSGSISVSKSPENKDNPEMDTDSDPKIVQRETDAIMQSLSA